MTSGITSENEWYNELQRVVQRVTTNDKECLVRSIFLFFEREKSTNTHLKENSLNLEEDLGEDLLN